MTTLDNKPRDDTKAKDNIAKDPPQVKIPETTPVTPPLTIAKALKNTDPQETLKYSGSSPETAFESSSPPVFEMKGLSFRYPMAESPALKDLDLSLSKGELLLLAGPSGGGKSTVIRLLNGLATHHYHGELKGDFKVLGKDHALKSLFQISSEVASVFQNPESQFFGLNPKDEILLAWECRGIEKDRSKLLLGEWSKTLKLSEFLLRPIAALSSGQKQKTILAESLALSPALLILDEPSANLDPMSVKELSKMLNILKEKGLSILIVDHHRRWMADGLADKAAILDKGKIVYKGNARDLDDPDLGLLAKWGLRPGPDAAKNAGKAPNATKTPPQSPSLDPSPKGSVKVKDLCFAYPKSPPLFSSFSLELYPGEVTAITGSNGSGKTTLLRLISGLLAPRSGSILFSDKALKERERLSISGVAMQNADRQLVMSSVAEEIHAALKDPDPEKVNEELLSWNLEGLAARHPQSLSGGEKQRLALSAALARKSEILLLDEPTSGLDGKNLSMVAEHIKKAASQKPVFLITHDADLLEQTEARIVSLSPPEEAEGKGAEEAEGKSEGKKAGTEAAEGK
jgi:energy-coupling factor transport system ATP-binding protein